MTLWGLVLAVHVLAMTVWTGGMAYALLVTRPSLAALSPADRLILASHTLRRFFFIVWHAMPLVLVTGWAMVFGAYGGFANADWTINAMQALGLAMALIFLTVFFGPWRRFRAEPHATIAERINWLIAVKLALAVLVIVVASLGHWRAG